MRAPISRLAQFLAAIFLASAAVSAQVTTLKGLVTDPSGAVIPAADVIVRSGNRVEFATRSDSEGIFLVNVRSKLVTIEINAPGFIKWERSDFRVPDSSPVDLGSIVLKAGAFGELLECPLAEVETIEARESSVSAEIQNRPLMVRHQTSPSAFGIVTGLITALENGGGNKRKTGKPVANAYVHFGSSAGDFRTRTDSKGRYRLELPPGRYSIYAAVDEACVICIEYYGKDFEVRAGKTAELNMVLRLIGEGTIPSRSTSVFGK